MNIDLTKINTTKAEKNKLYPVFLDSLKKIEFITFPYDEITPENIEKIKAGLKVKTKKTSAARISELDTFDF